MRTRKVGIYMKRIEKLMQKDYFIDEEVLNMQYSSGDERKVEELLVRFQNGDFSEKGDLFKYINCNDKDICKFTAVLACLVGTNSEIDEILDYVEKWEDKEIHYFIVHSVYFLSSSIGEFLVKMHEEWEETYVESAIENAMSYYLGIEIEENMEECEEYYEDIKESYISNRYYYNGELVDYHYLTAYVLEQARYSYYQNREIGAYTEIVLLSVASGKLCPINSHAVIDKSSMVNLGQYLDEINKMNLLSGVKYFWGHQII